MPRIKAPPQPAVPSLKGVTISLASYSPSAHPELGNKSVAQLKTDITNCGGYYTTKPNECTHLIASQAQFDKEIDRIKQAQKNSNILIVAYDWLADSLASSAPIDVDSYTFDEDSNSPTANGLTVNASPPLQTVAPAKKSSKRTRQQDDDDEDDLQPPKKSKKSDPPRPSAPSPAPTSNLKSSIKVPVDLQVPNAAAYTVYIDDAGVIYDATLNKSDSNKNNNKFYRIQLLRANDTFKTWTRWGRVGDKGQSKMLGDGDFDEAILQFKDKFKDKSFITWENRDGPSRKGKYVYLVRRSFLLSPLSFTAQVILEHFLTTLQEVNYEDSDGEAEKTTSAPNRDGDEEEKRVIATSKLPSAVQKLMELIFNQKFFDASMAELDYDANKMPLGKLSKKTLLKGYEVLKELAALVSDPTLADSLVEDHDTAVAERSNQYFSLVPHVVGRRAVPGKFPVFAIDWSLFLQELLSPFRRQ